MGFPVSFERIAVKAKWNWRKFLENLKKQGIKVSQETYEEALRLRKSLGHRVKVFELEYED
jgi:2-iminoacetate synthase ThiH